PLHLVGSSPPFPLFHGGDRHQILLALGEDGPHLLDRGVQDLLDLRGAVELLDRPVDALGPLAILADLVHHPLALDRAENLARAGEEELLFGLFEGQSLQAIGDQQAAELPLSVRLGGALVAQRDDEDAADGLLSLVPDDAADVAAEAEGFAPLGSGAEEAL